MVGTAGEVDAPVAASIKKNTYSVCSKRVSTVKKSHARLWSL
jgi:hypothetical protein